MAFSFLHKNGCSNISCTASSVVVNSCSYCLSGNLFVFPCILNNDTVWYNILDCGFLSFSTLNIFATPFWGVNLLLRNQLIALGNFPCTWPVHFLFAAFQIDSILNFCHFNYNISWSWLLWVHLVWNNLYFLNLYVCFVCQVRKDFCHYFFKYTFCPFPSLFSFWNTYNANVRVHDIAPEVPYTIILENSFFIFAVQIGSFTISGFSVSTPYFCVN